MHSAHKRLVLGLCPELFRPELEFLFVTVAAEFFNGFWVRRSNPEQIFSPKGDIFVPREVFPDEFHEGDAVVWDVEDQPNYVEQHVSCRFRAIRLAESPLELVSVPWLSTDPALRHYLQETGVTVFPRRTDRNVLLEFSDGLIARTRLQPKPNGIRSFVVPAADFLHPFEAWQPEKPFSLLTVETRRGSRRFCGLPVPPSGAVSLDLSTLDEALSTAKRPGGLGSIATLPLAELRQHLKRLTEAVQSFDAPAWQSRRNRLEQFLEQARGAIDERGKWEEFLTSQRVFHELVEAAVGKGKESLRQQVRASLLAEEQQLQQNLKRLTNEWEDLEGVKAATALEVAGLQQELAAMKGRHPAGVIDQTPPSHNRENLVEGMVFGALENGVPANRLSNSEKRTVEVRPSSIPHTRSVSLPLVASTDVLSTPVQALALLEKNLQSLGVIRVSSRLLAREVLVAASLGQLLLFRGSLASPVEETVAVSLAGSEARVVPVPLGAADSLILSIDNDNPVRSFVLDGINRSCLDAFGSGIQEQVRNRVLGPTKVRFPVLLGTLGEGPSCLPLGPHLVGFGPVFDTDMLSWDLQKNVGSITPGQCETGAWELSQASPSEEELGEFLDELFPAPCLFWERLVRAAFRRLAVFAEKERPQQPKWSLLFAWVLPRLFASEGDLSALTKHLTEGFLHGATSEDQRLRRLLQAKGIEVAQ